MTRTRPRIAVAGAGAVGRRHAALLAAADGPARLAGIAAPSPEASAFAAGLGARLHPDLDALLAAERPDGVILATPTGLHAEQALACIAAGVAVLVEKPLAASLADARRVTAAAEVAGVTLVVGHHRRHSPAIAAAKATIEAGRIGRPTLVDCTTWLMKPDAYFAPDWRRGPGAGPILTNLVHDLDLMRHLLGEVVSVQAAASHAARGFAAEDGAAVILRFACGALGVLSVSDATVAPWSWELTAADNPDYPATGQSCYRIAGDRGALELPSLRLWRNPGAAGWFEPLTCESLDAAPADPLARQIAAFAAVAAGAPVGATALATGRDGLAAMEILDAVIAAARSGGTVHLGDEAEAA